METFKNIIETIAWIITFVVLEAIGIYFFHYVYNRKKRIYDDAYKRILGCFSDVKIDRIREEKLNSARYEITKFSDEENQMGSYVLIWDVMVSLISAVSLFHAIREIW